MAQPLVEVKGEPTSGWSPVNLARYNRCPRLTVQERAAPGGLITSRCGRLGQQPEEVVVKR